MGLFTPTQFLKPSEWLVATSLVRNQILDLSTKSEFGMNSAQDLVNWSKLLLSIMKREKQLKELMLLQLDEKDELWYPIKVPSRIFGQLEQILLIHDGKIIPLSEEELSQVRANLGIISYLNLLALVI
ncbi:MAG: hypothetical protein WD512_20955 [Candidatus Paceibacterota bacterium]